ncbi:Nuclease SbcCD subunit C [bacterium HR21]|nr:Nuclease SbcCD subunit C [bacterium HR21]
MIPLELHIEGFLSYRNRQSLNFRPLVDAGLFGILGPTGSGKSALLEAILLALYGTCPRQKGNELLPLVNHHCSTLTVEFLFQLRRAGQTELYRCRYRARLKPGRKGVQQQEHLLERWDGQGWQRDREGRATEHRVSELLGLDYENFCRSILLPQGRFDELLQLTPSQRAEALEVLFHLHRYNLGETVRRLRAETDARRELLQRRFDVLAQTASAEIYQQLEQELEHLRIESHRLEQLLSKLQAADAEYTTRRHRWEEYRRLQQELAHQRHRVLSSAERKQRLEQLQRFLPLLHASWSQLQQLRRDAAAVTEQYNRARQDHARLRTELDALLPRYEQLRQAYEQRHQLHERLEHCRNALRCLDLHAQLHALDARLAKGRIVLEELQQRHREYTQRLTACRHRQRELTQELHTLSELLHWYEREHTLRRERQQLEADLQQLEQRLQHFLSALHDRSRALPQPYRPHRVQSAERYLEELQQAESHLHTELARLQSELESLHRQRTAAELARELVAGQPCPVCGSPHHPEPCRMDPTAELRLRELHSEHERLRTAFELTQHLRTELYAELRSVADRRHELTERLRTVMDQLAEHRRHFRWRGWEADAPEQKTLAEQRHAALRAELEQLQAHEQRFETDLLHLDRELETARQHFQQLDAQRSALAGQYELLRTSLPEELRHASAQALRELLECTQQQLAQLEHEFPLLKQRYEQLREQTESARLRCAYLAERHGQLRAEQDRLAQEFARQCDHAGFAPEDLEPFLQDHTRVLEELQRLQEEEQRLADLTDRLAALEPEATHYDPDQHEQLQHKLQHTREQLQELHVRQGQLQERLTRLKDTLAEQRQLQQQLDDLHLRSQRLKVLEELFRGNAFVAFVAQEYLRSLCHQANLYFRQWTHGTLELALSTAGKHPEFQVRDLLANGSLRPVRTLSGGQIFQASLALALALSDMVRSTSRLERCLFFIDEGFGSLDRDTLFVVLDTLRQLQRQGRLVGIISHREELQQELDAYVRIRRDAEHGSRIAFGLQ